MPTYTSYSSPSSQPFRPMKLVHLIQSLLLGVVVFGRAVEEQIADTSVVTDDVEQLPYRFRYNVANPISGDYKSQVETRDGAGVVTGMYKVLQPDGCVRVVHYTADAMGFHPTVTYEGDCKRGGSINAASQIQSSDSTIASTEEMLTPINPLTADLSRPFSSAVPGLISPPVTGVRDPAREVFAIRPSQQLTLPVLAAPSEKFVIVPVATTLSPKISSEIDSLGAGPLRPETWASGSVSTVTTNKNAVKTAVESEEINVESLPEALPTIELPSMTVNNTPSGYAQSSQQQTAEPLAVPSLLTGEVESSVTVPYSILSLLKGFDPVKTTVVQNGEVDRLLAQPSQFSERTLRTEPDSSIVSPAVEDFAIRSAVEEKLHLKTSDAEVVIDSDEVEGEFRESTPEVSAVHSEAEETVPLKITDTVETRSIPQPEEVKTDIGDSAVDDEFSLPAKSDETVNSKTLDNFDSEGIAQLDEKETEKERSIGSLAQSALANVHNLTAPLTQLISSSVQNLSNPLTTLLHSFNKNKLTSTVTPSTISPATEVTTTIAPAGKTLIEGETEDIPAERTVVTDHHNPEAISETDGVISDQPAIPEDLQRSILPSEGPAVEGDRVAAKQESLELKPSVDQNLESLSIEVNDPAVVIESGPSTDILQDSAESTVTPFSDTPVVSGRIVSDGDGSPTVAEGTSFESLKLVDLERQPTEQVQADVRDTSSFVVPIQTESESADADPAMENAKSYLIDSETPVHHIVPEAYASISDPVPVIYSQLQTAPFFVHQPATVFSPHTYPAPVRQSTARSVDSVAAMPYGLRVHAFVPNYGMVGNAPPSYVYNQHRRQGQFYRQQHYLPYRRFAPAAPIRSSKKGEAYGMRYSAVKTSPMKSRYAVRLPAVQQPTPLYSTYAY